jgi:hypothetical protein
LWKLRLGHRRKSEFRLGLSVFEFSNPASRKELQENASIFIDVRSCYHEHDTNKILWTPQAISPLSERNRF